MKDYYHILGVTPEAATEEVRRAWRKKALEVHPDRNRGDPGAEERFKEAAEAYGVLGDPEKRRHYDTARKAGGAQEAGYGGTGFRYSREEIFRDLFNDPRFQGMAGDLFREFQRRGLRGDMRFFERVFFGGRGFFVAGVFVFGPGRGKGRARVLQQGALEPGTRPSLLYRALNWLGGKMGGALKTGEARPELTEAAGGDAGGDLFYSISLEERELRDGAFVTIGVKRDTGRETLKVRIPPGTRPGTRLRLRGKGLRGGGGPGDIFLEVRL
jgi:curved DNA-binding protein CbpA